MANGVGKTKEFAEEIIRYLLNDADVGPVGPLKIGLLTNTLTTTEPFTGAELRAIEYDPGNFRSEPLDISAFGSVGNRTTVGELAVKAISSDVISFPATVPAGVTFTIYGYCLTRGDGITDSDYLAYEIFSDPNKRKTVGGDDSIRINSGSLVLLER